MQGEIIQGKLSGSKNVWHIFVEQLSRHELFRGNCLNCKGPKGSSEGEYFIGGNCSGDSFLNPGSFLNSGLIVRTVPILGGDLIGSSSPTGNY